VALGMSDGFIHNGGRRHRYGVLFQKEKVVKEAVFRKNPFDKRLKTHKLSGKEAWAFWVDYSYIINFKNKNLATFFVFCFITTPSLLSLLATSGLRLR